MLGGIEEVDNGIENDCYATVVYVMLQDGLS